MKLHAGSLRWAVTQRRVPATEGAFARDALDIAWCEWFARRGLRFLAVPNFEDSQRAVAYCDDWGVDALVLAGGEDVGTKPVRDQVEGALLARAARAGMPVLGVCRGMQFLQIASGGDLAPTTDHVGRPHRVTLGTGQPAPSVNSWHRWAVLQPAPGWETVARADDGGVEAMRHLASPWLAVMWHPERAGGETTLVDEWLRQSQECR